LSQTMRTYTRHVATAKSTNSTSSGTMPSGAGYLFTVHQAGGGSASRLTPVRRRGDVVEPDGAA
jgi:hypothetical protein